jgi:hypothetical protein
VLVFVGVLAAVCPSVATHRDLAGSFHVEC